MYHAWQLERGFRPLLTHFYALNQARLYALLASGCALFYQTDCQEGCGETIDMRIEELLTLQLNRTKSLELIAAGFNCRNKYKRLTALVVIILKTQYCPLCFTRLGYCLLHGNEASVVFQGFAFLAASIQIA